jgi:hypothetical protein
VRMKLDERISEENVGRVALHAATLYWISFFVCLCRDLSVGELNSKFGWFAPFVAFTGTVGPVFYILLCRVGLRRLKTYSNSWRPTRMAKVIWAVSPLVPVFGALTLLVVIVIRNR